MNQPTAFRQDPNPSIAGPSSASWRCCRPRPRKRPAQAKRPGCSGTPGFALLAIALLAFAPVPAALSDNLDKPQGRVILRVTGAVDCPNTDSGAAFDRALLESIGLSTLVTMTPWSDRENTFEGVPARKLFAAVCAKGKLVYAKAHNDYMVAIPMADFENSDVLLAMRMDGKALTLRDKGPVWIVYPAVGGKHTLDQQSRMVWQLKELIVERE